MQEEFIFDCLQRITKRWPFPDRQVSGWSRIAPGIAEAVWLESGGSGLLVQTAVVACLRFAADRTMEFPPTPRAMRWQGKHARGRSPGFSGQARQLALQCEEKVLQTCRFSVDFDQLDEQIGELRVELD